MMESRSFAANENRAESTKKTPSFSFILRIRLAPDDPVGRKHGLEARLTELLIEPIVHAEIGIKQRARPGKGEQELIVFGHRPGEKRSTKTLPTTPAISELHIFPNTAVFDLLGSKVNPHASWGISRTTSVISE